MWVKLSDDFFDHVKVVRAGKDARDLWLVGLAFANHNLTDGFIAAESLPILAAKAVVDDPLACTQRLVDVGLWEPREGGWLIHDYADYNDTALEMAMRRKEDAKRKADKRARVGRDTTGQFMSGRTSAGQTPESGPMSGECPPYPVPVPVLDPGDVPIGTSGGDAARARAPRPPSRRTRTPLQREADAMIESIKAAFGIDGEVNDSLHAALGKVGGLLRQDGVQPNQVAELHERIRAVMPPDCTFTMFALPRYTYLLKSPVANGRSPPAPLPTPEEVEAEQRKQAEQIGPHPMLLEYQRRRKERAPT